MKVSPDVLDAIQTYDEDGFVHDGAYRLIGAVYGRLVFAVRRASHGLPRRVHWARLIQRNNPGAAEFLFYDPEIFDVADDDMAAMAACVTTTVQQMEERYRLDKAGNLRNEPFTFLYDGDDEAHLSCKNCDTEFWSDAYGENVMCYDHALWPKCPKCGATKTIEIVDPPEKQR